MFTDISQELLYPIMPVYLKTIGFSIVLIGILEGVAEATAGLSKGYFGNWSDNLGKRLPFVQIGYGLSSISKPMLAAFTFPFWVFLCRTTDRLGKGIRTGARDALLSNETTPEFKGRIFGFHRAMDTLGAAIGPALALVFLLFYPGEYRLLFLIAFAPGLIALSITFFIREVKIVEEKVVKKTGLLDFFSYLKVSSPSYRKLLFSLLIFALFNSSDVFLLLKIKDAGFSDTIVIGAYVFYNLVYALFAFPMGWLADKLGMKTVFVAGLILFSSVYAGMAFASTQIEFLFLFFLYGIFAASTEGIAKAWLSNLCPPHETATAIGTYTAFQSLCTLVASSAAGLIWYYYSPATTFLATAVVVGVVTLFLLGQRREG